MIRIDCDKDKQILIFWVVYIGIFLVLVGFLAGYYSQAVNVNGLISELNLCHAQKGELVGWFVEDLYDENNFSLVDSSFNEEER